MKISVNRARLLCTDDKPAIVEVDLSEAELFKAVDLDWRCLPHFTHRSNEAWFPDERRPEYMRAPAMFYCDLVGIKHPDYAKGIYSSETSCQPEIRVCEKPKGWLVITYQQKNQPGEKGFLFGHRDDGEVYQYVPIPDGCTIDPNTLAITLRWEGRDFRFPQDQCGWPEVLLDQKRFITLGLLRRLLTGSDTNPITILMNMNRASKGVASQVVEELELAVASYPV